MRRHHSLLVSSLLLVALTPCAQAATTQDAREARAQECSTASASAYADAAKVPERDDGLPNARKEKLFTAALRAEAEAHVLRHNSMDFDEQDADWKRQVLTLSRMQDFINQKLRNLHGSEERAAMGLVVSLSEESIQVIEKAEQEDKAKKNATVDVDVKYDAFEDKTTASTAPRVGSPEDGISLRLNIHAVYAGKVPKGAPVSIMLSLVSVWPEWRFAGARSLVFIANGERITLGEMSRSAKVAGAHELIEVMTTNITADNVKSLSQGEVRGRVGTVEFPLNQDDQHRISKLLEYIASQP